MRKFLCQLYRSENYFALKIFSFRTVAWIQLGVGQVPVLDSARTDKICFKGSQKWMSVLIEEIPFCEKLGLFTVSQTKKSLLKFGLLYSLQDQLNFNKIYKIPDFLMNIWLYFALTVSSTSQKCLASSYSFLLWSLDPCRNFHCKRGKVCHVDKQGKPSCICQDPAACPSTKDYEHVSISFSAQHGEKNQLKCLKDNTFPCYYSE